jgi:hypothetical protein
MKKMTTEKITLRQLEEALGTARPKRVIRDEVETQAQAPATRTFQRQYENIRDALYAFGFAAGAGGGYHPRALVRLLDVGASPSSWKEVSPLVDEAYSLAAEWAGDDGLPYMASFLTLRDTSIWDTHQHWETQHHEVTLRESLTLKITCKPAREGRGWWGEGLCDDHSQPCARLRAADDVRHHLARLAGEPYEQTRFVRLFECIPDTCDICGASVTGRDTVSADGQHWTICNGCYDHRDTPAHVREYLYRSSQSEEDVESAKTWLREHCGKPRG